MSFFRLMVSMVLCMAVASCGILDFTYVRYADPVTKTAVARGGTQSVTVTVPNNLRVSEADVYYPIADVVWRGEPLGNRYEQVAGIFQDAAKLALKGLPADEPIKAEIVVIRFHALTEKTRYAMGGVYSILFRLTLKDPETGEVIYGPHTINGEMPATGGIRALAQEMQGQTQRDEIVKGLAATIEDALIQPPL
jgi:hypothetical protein